MFSHMLRQTITVKTVSGVDAYGEPVIAGEAEIPCKIKYSNQLIRNRQGVEVTANAVIRTRETVGLEDLITLEGRDWQVLQSSPVYDFDGSIQGYKIYI